MNGEIYLTSLSTLNKAPTTNVRKFFIVRKPGKVDVKTYNLELMPDLAPSEKLLKLYLGYKQAGDWNEKSFEHYKQIFNEEMKERNPQVALDKITDILRSGTSVVLVCFCDNENLCHRSIIGDHFRRRRFEVSSVNRDTIPGITITFTGHRPQKLKGGYDYYSEPNKSLKKEIFEKLYQEMSSYKKIHFICGGALGVDQMAFEVAVYIRTLEKRKGSDGKSITIEQAVPFDNMDTKWINTSRELHKKQSLQADKVTVVSPGGYEAYKMNVRNEYMVDNADVILAVWDGSENSGTGRCVKYAADKGKKIVRVNL